MEHAARKDIEIAHLPARAKFRVGKIHASSRSPVIKREPGREEFVMSSLATSHRLPERRFRVSRLSEGDTAALRTLQRRAPDRLFDVSGGGAGLVTDNPLPRGTLVLARIKPPSASRAFDVIVRVARVERQALGLEFIFPDDALVKAVRDHFHT